MNDFNSFNSKKNSSHNQLDDSIINQLIDSLTHLPTVGIKTAERMSYFLLTQNNQQQAKEIAHNLQRAVDLIRHCKQCRNLTEFDTCPICLDKRRDESLICVVESPINLMNLEKTGQYFGQYFVLMGLISPIDGIGAKELGLDLLTETLANGKVKEIILAISASVEGQATSYYLKKLAQKYEIKTTQLAQGVPVGSELDYIDQKTLALALNERHQF